MLFGYRYPYYTFLLSTLLQFPLQNIFVPVSFTSGQKYINFAINHLDPDPSATEALTSHPPGVLRRFGLFWSKTFPQG